jgi:predicted acyl esterase
MLRRTSPLLLLFILTITASLYAQNRPDAPEFDVKEHYTKYEYRIAMRDGVHLFTSVYIPVPDQPHAL